MNLVSEQQPCQPSLNSKVENVGLNTEHESTPDVSTKLLYMFNSQRQTSLQKMNQLFNLLIKIFMNQEMIFVPRNDACLQLSFVASASNTAAYHSAEIG